MERLGFWGQSHLSTWLVSILSSSATFGGNLRHAYSAVTVYSHFREYSSTTAKLGPLAYSEICALESDLNDKSLTNLVLMLSWADETGLGDVASVVVAAVVSVEI